MFIGVEGLTIGGEALRGDSVREGIPVHNPSKQTKDVAHNLKQAQT